MSVFEQFANKPWGRPTQYTSDADPSHEDVVQLGTPQPARTPSDYGDGRPNQSMADNTPMDYRRGDREAVIDVDDDDELDMQEPYMVQPKLDQGRASMAVQDIHGMPSEEELQRDMPTPMARTRDIKIPSGIGLRLASVMHGSVVLEINGQPCHVDANSIAIAARKLYALAEFLA